MDSDGDFSLEDFQKRRLFFGIQGKKALPIASSAIYMTNGNVLPTDAIYQSLQASHILPVEGQDSSP